MAEHGFLGLAGDKASEIIYTNTRLIEELDEHPQWLDDESTGRRWPLHYAIGISEVGLVGHLQKLWSTSCPFFTKDSAKYVPEHTFCGNLVFWKRDGNVLEASHAVYTRVVAPACVLPFAPARL